LREKWEVLKNDLGDLELFGENLYAIHSIKYENLDSHYYVFGVRLHEQWLSWEETKFYAACFDFPTVPVLQTVQPSDDQQAYEQSVLELVKQPSVFGSSDILQQKPCTMEGVVSRNMESYAVDDFQNHVFKYVRKGHVKTDEHWTRNWKRAPLNFEKNVDDQ
jgi:hypothetical protein